MYPSIRLDEYQYIWHKLSSLGEGRQKKHKSKALAAPMSEPWESNIMTMIIIITNMTVLQEIKSTHSLSHILKFKAIVRLGLGCGRRLLVEAGPVTELVGTKAQPIGTLLSCHHLNLKHSSLGYTVMSYIEKRICEISLSKWTNHHTGETQSDFIPWMGKELKKCSLRGLLPSSQLYHRTSNSVALWQAVQQYYSIYPIIRTGNFTVAFGPANLSTMPLEIPVFEKAPRKGARRAKEPDTTKYSSHRPSDQLGMDDSCTIGERENAHTHTLKDRNKSTPGTGRNKRTRRRQLWQLVPISEWV